MRHLKKIYYWLCENEFKIFAVIAFLIGFMIWLYLLTMIDFNY